MKIWKRKYNTTPGQDGVVLYTQNRKGGRTKMRKRREAHTATGKTPYIVVDNNGRLCDLFIYVRLQGGVHNGNIETETSQKEFKWYL